MKPAVALLLGLGSVPVLAAAGVSWLGADDVQRVLDGENVTDVAADVARREFSASATLEILEIEPRPQTVGSWGDAIDADDGSLFHHVRVRLTNDGKLDLPVHTRHFRAYDETGRAWRAEWGLTHVIDNPRLAPGDFEVGIVVFEMPTYVPLVRVEWLGDLASANATVAEMMERRVADAADADIPAVGQPGVAIPEDEYQSHWEVASPATRP